jgi:putative flippase GtrA
MAELALRSAALSALIRYGVVGLGNTAFGLGAMALFAFLGAHYVVYTTIGYVLAFCMSYTLNGIFTFRSGPLSTKQFVGFVAVNGCLLLVTQVLQYLVIDVAGARELLGVFIGAVFYMIVGFLLNKHIVFRPA